MCYLWSEFWGTRGYLGSDTSSMSLSKRFLSIKFNFRNWTADNLGSLKKLV